MFWLSAQNEVILIGEGYGFPTKLNLVFAKERGIEEKDEIIKAIQDKNYENQLEIIDIKKELSEYSRMLDEKTSS